MFAAWVALLCVAPPALAQAPSPLPAAAVPTKAPCPTPEESRRISELYAKSPAPMTFAAAPQLKLTEVIVAGGLPRSLGTGVDGAHFREIWASLTEWPSAMVLIMKGGNVFEITTRIPPGEPSKRSKYFNLDDAALSGHLRPDLISAIHAVQLPAQEGQARGLLFYDEKGDSVFGVFLAEGADPTAEQLAKFEQTWRLLQSLPQRCAAPGLDKP
jgi:putative heme iron utilization protein